MTQKILLYGINFAPELTGIGKYTGEMAAWLAARGHQVRVVTAPPYYPAWKVGDGFRNGWTTEVMDCRGAGAPRNDDEPDPSLRAKRGNPGCLVVYRCPLWVPRQPGGLKRLLHLASFALSSLPVMLRQIVWRPDVVWVVEPALFCAPAAVVVARLSGARAWLHVQDFEVDAAFDLGLLRGKLLRGLVTGAERWLMRRFDVVSTISQRMHQRLLAKGVAPAKARMAVNWVDLAAFGVEGDGLPRCARNDSQPRHREAEGRGDLGCSGYRVQLGIAPDAVVALYSGNMGGKQGLEVLADVARLCPEVVFVFCGNGAGRADLVARCQGLANVLLMELQPVERLPDLLAMADIHLLPQRADAADLVMPSKLTGMLASARPVVATAKPGTELANVVQACGLVVPPEDALAFADALKSLAADPELRERLGGAGFLYAQAHLDKEAVLAKFEADLLGLVLG
ncbi:MAG: glycosyltransferase WbuB [Rhodoferax sp.]|uniref:glycosyltransferase WbuB n=1 Tax=Rhodoferax sp. TaxID=50421 RepID=UPI003C7265DD